MSRNSGKCFQCRGPASLERIGPVSGEESQLTVTLRELPVLVCEKGHRQFEHARLAMQQLLHVAEGSDGRLPISLERGFFFKRPVCVDCGARVEKISDEPQTFHFEVAVDEAAAFGIDVTMPVLRCRRCGKEQARSRRDVQGRAPAALLRALRAAGIGHS